MREGAVGHRLLAGGEGGLPHGVDQVKRPHAAALNTPWHGFDPMRGVGRAGADGRRGVVDIIE